VNGPDMKKNSQQKKHRGNQHPLFSVQPKGQGTWKDEEKFGTDAG